MTRSVSLLQLPLMLASSVAAQDIRARVVEDASRQPIAGATATLLSNNSVVTRSATDANGFFRIRPTAPGEYELAVEMLGYATERRQVSFSGQELIAPAFVLRAQAIALDPLEATARSRTDPTAVVGFSRSSQLIASARLARLEGIVSGPIALVREMSGLRTREFKAPSGLPVLCVEAVRRMLDIAGHRAAASGRSSSSTAFAPPTVPVTYVPAPPAVCFVNCRCRTWRALSTFRPWKPVLNTALMPAPTAHWSSGRAAAVRTRIPTATNVEARDAPAYLPVSTLA